MTNFCAPWIFTILEKPSLKNVIFIEGLPGIGNTGKVVVDFLIEHSKAKKIAHIFSYNLPNSVFVSEDNLVELPKVELFHAKIKKQDFLFLTGDVQPTNEMASYTFCEEILKRKDLWSIQKIITLGGIGLEEIPLEPDVFCTGNNKDFIQLFVDKGANDDVYNTVGPIIGVSGLLLGMAKLENIPAVTLLAETLGHPMYLGLRGAKSTLQLLFEVYNLTFDLTSLDEEIETMESDNPGDNDSSKSSSKASSLLKHKLKKDTNYIG